MAKKLSTSFSINDLSKIKSLSEDSFKAPFEKDKSELEKPENLSTANTNYESKRPEQKEKNNKIFNQDNIEQLVDNQNNINSNINNELNKKDSTLLRRLSSKQQLLRRHSSFVKKRMREMKIFQLENINKNNLFKIIAYDLNKEKNVKENNFYFITHNHLLLIQWFVNTSSKCKNYNFF